MSFIWRPGDPPPTIEEHSKAKLSVLRMYLRDYLDLVIGRMVRADSFTFDLVDGFSGGGLFLDEFGEISGTPLIMLEEIEAARVRLNLGRIKPILIDCKFHFVDVAGDHTDFLRSVLEQRGSPVDGNQIVLHTGRFSDVAGSIISDIQSRQPRSGRSIFLLDQTGFSHVDLLLVRRILGNLQNSEVILTIASDALLNQLSDRRWLNGADEALALSESDLREMIALKGGDGGKAVAQRYFRDHVRSVTGATYDTPFFIRPQHSRRALWFVHLSKHPSARDVMMQCHWKSSNVFQHYGAGGFDMLGWDALRSGSVPLFDFSEHDAKTLRDSLLVSLPSELYSLSSDIPVEVSEMHRRLANCTAARYSDLDSIVLELARSREFDVLSGSGKVRSRSIRNLNPTDRISLPRAPFLPGFSSLLSS